MDDTQDRGQILRRFAERLEELRLAAGNPPYADLARRSPWLKRSTISDVLRGRSGPSLDFVVAFVAACKAYAEARISVPDPDRFDIEAWRSEWRDLQRQLGALRRAKPAGRAERDGGGSALPTPRQLPPPPRPFIGREPYVVALDQLPAAIASPTEASPSAVAVDGAAGIGKTALVLHWAHQVRDQYPDGNLYLDLRGYGAAEPPVSPAEALRTLLQVLGVPPSLVPEDAHQLSALWRSVLAERRVLVIVDNARSAAQVRPLLPGAGGSILVITSRRRLGGLLARDGVRPVSLAAMTPAESHRLIRSTIGALADAEPQAADSLARLCGHSPLAIRILAERVATQPRPLARVVQELTAARPLDALATTDDDESAAVRSVLEWSYRTLPEGTARMFRLLAVHPGPHLSAEAAAVLARVPVDRAGRELSDLADLHLLIEGRGARYHMHDLVRYLSAEKLDEDEGVDEKRDAMRRELLWYLHSFAGADRVIMPGRRSLVEDPAPAGLEPVGFGGYHDALAWCDAERDNLVGIVRLAAEQRWYDICWRLPTILLSYFDLRKAWFEWITSFEVALSAARALDDRLAEAMCANALGIAHRELRHTRTALAHFRTAVDLFRELGIDEGESYALNNIGITYQRSDNARAAAVLRQALQAARSGGSVPAALTALHNLGEAYLGLGRFSDAVGCIAQCLDISERIEDRAGVGFALTSLGEIYANQRRWDEALRYLRTATVIRAEVGDVQGEATALFRLGRALTGSGDRLAAGAALQHAREIFERLGDPLALDVRAFQRRL